MGADKGEISKVSSVRVPPPLFVCVPLCPHSAALSLSVSGLALVRASRGGFDSRQRGIGRAENGPSPGTRRGRVLCEGEINRRKRRGRGPPPSYGVVESTGRKRMRAHFNNTDTLSETDSPNR